MRNRFLVGLALAANWMCGCGAGDAGSFAAGNPSPASGVIQQVTVSGRVLSEGGAGQAGVRIIANERTSDAKVEAFSGADGSFQVSLPSGVYDIGLDRPGDSLTATCFYGPIPLTGDVQQDLVLHPSNGKPAGHVSGKLWLRPGVPAVNRRINLRSAHLSGATTNPSLALTTAADGSFQQVLGSEQEMGLDIEVFDGQGNLDEVIDIGKLAKPAYVEFATELPLPANRLRSDESDPLGTSLVRAKTAEFVAFNHLESKPVPGSPNLLVLSQGLLPVDGVERHFFDGATDLQTNIATGIMTQSLALQFNAYRGYTASGTMKVARNGSWWWTYAVNINPDSASYFVFQDETGDSYSLHVFFSGFYWHKVSYNSDKPNIQAMATVDPLSPPPGQ